MALGNTLIGDSAYFPNQETAPSPSSTGEGAFLLSAPGAGDNIPRLVALLLVLAVGILVAVQLAGLRAMVTVGGGIGK